MGIQDRTLIDINDSDWYQSLLSNFDESPQKLNMKTEHEYKQGNIFIVSAAYLFKSFYHVSLTFIKFLPAGRW